MKAAELAKVKLDRAIRLSKDFDRLDSEDLYQIFLYLTNTLKIMPPTTERNDLYNYVKYLNSMSFERYGELFKGLSWKSTVMFGKRELTELVWRVNSLLPP